MIKIGEGHVLQVGQCVTSAIFSYHYARLGLNDLKVLVSLILSICSHLIKVDTETGDCGVDLDHSKTLDQKVTYLRSGVLKEKTDESV